jgi:hypothetical protein
VQRIFWQRQPRDHTLSITHETMRSRDEDYQKRTTGGPMRVEPDAPRRPSEVAMWHKLSGLPDNVTDEGDYVAADSGRRARSEKAVLRAAIADLSAADMPEPVRSRARLAASYLLAGDAETARRYVAAAQELLAGCRPDRPA